jgi:HAD superfamily hydrolase (TIGR01509 family)
MNIKAIIFDLDGLVINSEVLWKLADEKMWAKRDCNVTSELFLKVLGTGLRKTVEIYKEEFRVKESTEALEKERVNLFSCLLGDKLEPMDGLYNLLERIPNDICLAIGSGGPHKNNIEKILNKLKIKRYFRAIVTGEEVKKSKPDPEVFLLAAKKLKIKPADCLVLEDAPTGIVAAKRAGMMVYGVNKNKIVREELEKAGADKVFSNLGEVEI